MISGTNFIDLNKKNKTKQKKNRKRDKINK